MRALTRPLRHLAAALGAALLAATGPAAALETAARAAMVVDHSTGAVLLSKNGDMPIPPASMSKLMTLYMVFEALRDGRLELADTFRVSTKAWQTGGSKMFLREGQEVSIEDLIRGVIVQSGNDASVVLAEGLGGTEAAFAQRMTRRARELGMMDSTFANATGLPARDHRMSPRDLIMLATRLIEDFPDYYPYFAETVFTWDGIEQENRNPLLGLGIGADGLKTGHTEEAGFGLVGSAVQDGRRVTFVIAGLDTARERLVESERLVNWAFREFFNRTLFEAGAPITNARVWLGEAAQVPLVSQSGVTATVPWAEKENIAARVEYTGPIRAPIAAGQDIAELVVDIPEIGEARYPLQAGAAIAEGGFTTRLETTARLLANRALEAALGPSE